MADGVLPARRPLRGPSLLLSGLSQLRPVARLGTAPPDGPSVFGPLSSTFPLFCTRVHFNFSLIANRNDFSGSEVAQISVFAAAPVSVATGHLLRNDPVERQ